MQLERLDHLVLTVRDVAATCEFYARALGMREVTFDGGRKALAFGEQKINLHPLDREGGPNASCPMPGSADVRFLTQEPLARVIAHLRECDVPILLGPVDAPGRRGRSCRSTSGYRTGSPRGSNRMGTD